MGGSLVDSLTDLRDALSRARLPLSMPGAPEADRQAKEMVAQLNDYVLPRLESLDAPLLAVVGGSTGAGKSTLVNSLIGREVSRPGVIRPTTRSPVLVHHPDDLSYFQSDRILPGLARSFQQVNDTSTLQLVAEPSLPPGLALLDAPDIDSVVQENRALAAQLLAAADLWLFVTSAARYADAVPWEYLLNAAGRSAAVAVVLDRVPPAAMHDVPAHLGRLMMERGLGESPLFAVPETATDEAGMLPDAAVSPIRDWLATIAADTRSRQAVVLQTLDGAIGSLISRAPAVAEALDQQGAAADQLWADAEKSYQEAARTVGVQTADGSMLRGEVLARWQDFVGTGEFMRSIERRVGWLRDKVVGMFRGEPPEAQEGQTAVQTGLETMIVQEGEAAAERTESAWLGHPAGRQVLTSTPEDLSRASERFPDAVARAIRDWQGDVLELVSAEGADKRVGARFLAVGVNGVGLALMIVVFASTSGLTGAEFGIAGGTAVLAQRFLEAFFGDSAVRRMARTAKEALDDRVQGLMGGELDRYQVALDRVGLVPGQADTVREAAATLRSMRASGDYTIESQRRRELAATQPVLERDGSPEREPLYLPGQRRPGEEPAQLEASGQEEQAGEFVAAGRDVRRDVFGFPVEPDRPKHDEPDADEDEPGVRRWQSAPDDGVRVEPVEHGVRDDAQEPGLSDHEADEAGLSDHDAEVLAEFGLLDDPAPSRQAPRWGDRPEPETVQGEVLDPPDPTQGRRVRSDDE